MYSEYRYSETHRHHYLRDTHKSVKARPKRSVGTTLDIELVDELDEASRKVAGTHRLPTEAATAYVQDLAEIFVADPSSLHWWESLKSGVIRVPYGNADGLAKLESLLGDQADVRLVVTDEEEPPWPVYVGGARQLMAMLRECRYCEYMLAASDLSWVIFDTHMNELVSVGLEICPCLHSTESI